MVILIHFQAPRVDFTPSPPFFVLNFVNFIHRSEAKLNGTNKSTGISPHCIQIASNFPALNESVILFFLRDIVNVYK